MDSQGSSIAFSEVLARDYRQSLRQLLHIQGGKVDQITWTLPASPAASWRRGIRVATRIDRGTETRHLGATYLSNNALEIPSSHLGIFTEAQRVGPPDRSILGRSGGAFLCPPGCASAFLVCWSSRSLDSLLEGGY
jgi:hypothetical protein